MNNNGFADASNYVKIENPLAGFELLKEFKGKKILKIFSDMNPICSVSNCINMGYYIFQSDVDENPILLKNEYRHFYKEVDYPCFTLKYVENDFEAMKPYSFFNVIKNQKIEVPFKWIDNTINKTVTDIKIFRDSVVWKYSDISWNVMCDVALKFMFEDEYIMFVLDDFSSAGFIPSLRNYVQDDDEVINHFWSKAEWGCKAEEPQSFQRFVISVW